MPLLDSAGQNYGAIVLMSDAGPSSTATSSLRRGCDG